MQYFVLDLKTTAANNNIYFASKTTLKEAVVTILGQYEMQCTNIFHLSSTPFTTSSGRTDEVLRISTRCDVTKGTIRFVLLEDTLHYVDTLIQGDF